MRRLISSAFLAALATALAASPSLSAETTGADAARAAFAALVEIEGKQPPSVTGTIEAEGASIEARGEWQTKRAAADAKFRAAFAAADWANWAVSDEHADDARVLERGLLDIGESAIAADDRATAVKAFERTTTLPKPSMTAARRIADGRPAAYVTARMWDKARETAASIAATASPEDLPSALMRQGDVECAVGHLDEARAFYAKASASAATDGMVFGRAAVAALQAKWKLDVVGKPLGDLAPEWCLGCADGKAPDLAGKIAVLCFPDPFRAEQFDAPALSRLGSKFTRVVGVFSTTMTMCLPETVMDRPTEGFPRLRGEPQPDGLRGWAERLARIAHADFPMIGVPPSSLPLGKAVLGSVLVVRGNVQVEYLRVPDEPISFTAAAVDRLFCIR